MNNLGRVIEADASLIETELCSYLAGEDAKFPALFEAMRYGVLGGGKRVRPFLCVEICKMLGGSFDSAAPFACAVELIHSYSLVHDDLPCMDNDVLRRGKPTMHVKYGEANALLCGDALLTFAFDVASQNKHVAPEGVVAAVRTLATKAGAFGMVGGQQLDMDSENKSIELCDLQYLHSLKTGALISCACELGYIASGCGDDSILADIRDYAAKIGVTFQIIDDILDKTGDQAQLGKTIGKDEDSGKTTYLTFMSVEDAYAEARRLTDEAVGIMKKYPQSELLCDFANWLCERKK